MAGGCGAYDFRNEHYLTWGDGNIGVTPYEEIRREIDNAAKENGRKESDGEKEDLRSAVAARSGDLRRAEGGDQRDLVFENIRAIDCGDDGFSAHEAAECRIDGFTSIGNSTGLCDTVASRTHYRNVYIRDCLGYDVFFVSHGSHSIENALIESSAARAVSVGRDSVPHGECAVRFKNVLVRRVGGGPQELRIGRGGTLEAERCTFENLLVQATPGSAVHFTRCLVAGNPKPEVVIWKDAAWSGAGNRYDVQNLRVDRTDFTPSTFAEFQKLTGSEGDSQWIGSHLGPRTDSGTQPAVAAER